MNSNFFKTEDTEQIFYSTNFEIKHDEEYHNVLIFNYGLVCSNHHWGPQLEFFDNLGYKILTHDYRGHYQSTGKENLDKINFQQMAEDLKIVCEHIGIKSCILLGHSMGVNVCLEVAKQNPSWINSMVLISGTIMPVNDIMFNSNVMEHIEPLLNIASKKFPKIYKKVWKYAGWNPIANFIIHREGFNKKTVDKEFIEIYLNRMGQLRPELFLHLYKQMSEHDILAHVSNMKIPTLIIGGDNDNVIPNYLQFILNKYLQNSEIYVIKNGSHVPQIDFPELINERVELFFDDQSDTLNC